MNELEALGIVIARLQITIMNLESELAATRQQLHEAEASDATAEGQV